MPIITDTFCALGQAARTARKQLGLTQPQLALAASVGVRLIVDMEAGKPSLWLENVLRVRRLLAQAQTTPVTKPYEKIMNKPNFKSCALLALLAPSFCLCGTCASESPIFNLVGIVDADAATVHAFVSIEDAKEDAKRDAIDAVLR